MAKQKILVIDDSPTILKVVQLVLSKAGYSVSVSDEGEKGIGLAKTVKPDLILLDFVMPKMNGYQVCKKLLEDPELSQIPVILMSAKGEQVGTRFIKVMSNVVDYITKPFSPDTIQSLVEHTLKRVDKLDDDTTATNYELTEDELEQETEDEAARRSRVLKSTIDQILRPSVEALAQAGVDEEVAEGALRQAWNERFFEKFISHIKTQAPELITGEIALAGNLEVVPISDVLMLLDKQRHTGELTVTGPEGKIDIYFNAGEVAFATSSGTHRRFLLGRYILELGFMTEEELERFLQQQPERRLVGLMLVKAGLITKQELRQAMALQVSHIVYEVLLWTEGKYVFTPLEDLPPRAREAGLQLHVDGLLMEGFRRVDEWHMIEREIEDFDMVLIRDENAISRFGIHRLTPEEVKILELVNGRNTVRDIIKKTRMGTFEVARLLYRLLSTGLIRKKVTPVAV